MEIVDKEVCARLFEMMKQSENGAELFYQHIIQVRQSAQAEVYYQFAVNAGIIKS